MIQFDPIPPLRDHVIAAIRLLRAQIRWKPGKGLKHVRTRQKYGHLPLEATLADYELGSYSSQEPMSTFMFGDKMLFTQQL